METPGVFCRVGHTCRVVTWLPCANQVSDPEMVMTPPSTLNEMRSVAHPPEMMTASATVLSTPASQS